MNEQDKYILTVTCPADSGIVAAITGFLASRDCYLTEMAQYDDEATGKFFSRVVFRRHPQKSPVLEEIQSGFADLAEQFSMQWRLKNAAHPARVVIMVSRADHCLVDLLYRKNKGQLHMEIAAVISNHIDTRPMVEREGIRFIYLPVDNGNRGEQEARILEVVAETTSELVILARYMQILSDELCASLRGRCINIHHSFLPGFKGARPYHQAYERGVKLIGATAHYVTADLDEGPIIEQEVERVDHTCQPPQLTAIGRDLENRALAKAVQYHIERRVFVDKNKTVVFR